MTEIRKAWERNFGRKLASAADIRRSRKLKNSIMNDILLQENCAAGIWGGVVFGLSKTNEHIVLSVSTPGPNLCLAKLKEFSDYHVYENKVLKYDVYGAMIVFYFKGPSLIEAVVGH